MSLNGFQIILTRELLLHVFQHSNVKESHKHWEQLCTVENDWNVVFFDGIIGADDFDFVTDALEVVDEGYFQLVIVHVDF